ncbi:MAG: ABC transporter ATP-binding protein [Desulfobacterales bacterium]|nr:ABC transporter ATP-binding protein [Desulfobacterales bacterium]
MKPMIEIRSISKKYCIQKNQIPYQTLRDSLISYFKVNQGKKDFWALDNISFNIQPGEKLGIIGENGAGKTTLLKILSKITPPTTGSILMRGKVASLLEVGTGFHPELTGRENVFLNGSILGLTKHEIQQKFKQIIDFSEIETFIDTPVKHYSSGMWARLAFSIAAHLDPEILLVDEVLSVGDWEFQQKSLAKMNDLKNQGKTLVFVSHNMGAIKNLCTKCLYLCHGTIKAIGDPEDVIQTYLAKKGYDGKGFVDLTNHTQRPGTHEVRFTSVELKNQKGFITSSFEIGDDLNIHLFLYAEKKIRKVKLVISINEADGNRVCEIFDTDSGFSLTNIFEETHVSVCLEDLRLYPGKYDLSVEVLSEINNYKYHMFDDVTSCISFQMLNNNINRNLRRNAGLFYFTPIWKIHDTMTI